SVTTGSVTLTQVKNNTDAKGHAQVQAVVPATAQIIGVQANVPGNGTVTFHARITDGSDIVLDTIARNLDNPVYVTAPAGDSRLFIVQQTGKILVYKNGNILPNPFLDLTNETTHGGEQGVLSIAFHPDYANNGFVFVEITDLNGDT